MNDMFTTMPSPHPAESAGDSSKPAAVEEVILETPLSTLIRFHPGFFDVDAIPQEEMDRKIDIRVSDLWGQLAKGRIQTPFQRFSSGIPSAYLSHSHGYLSSDLVELPLQEIVHALGPEMMNQMMPKAEEVRHDDVPDLFDFDGPAETGDHEDQAPEPPPPLHDPFARSVQPTPPESSGRADVESTAPAASTPEEKGLGVGLNGIDLNSASVNQLLSGIQGVGYYLAKQIVKSREQDGPYLSIYDLARVQGIGKRTFERLTGCPWRECGGQDRSCAMDVLGVKEELHVSFPRIAARFGEMNGFDGCLIVDEDGESLAESWGDEAGEALGAFVPQLLTRVAPYIKAMGVNEIDFLTLSLSDRPFTMIPVEHVIFIAVHQPDRFSRRQVRFVQQIARTLGVMLRAQHHVAG